VPWCVTLNLLQKPLHYRGIHLNFCPSFVYVGLARCALQVLDRGAQAVARGDAFCASQGCVYLSWCPGCCPRRRSLCVECTLSLRPAVARGAAQVVGRGAQAVARGVARCASRLLDRDAKADARGGASSWLLPAVARR
jgi:hypothetical protein